MRVLLFSLLSILLVSCVKIGPITLINKEPTPDVLPPITTEGAGTCGYKADGQIVEFRTYFTFSPLYRPTLRFWYDSTGRIRIYCYRGEHAITIEKDSVFQVGTYELITKKYPDYRKNISGGYYFRKDSIIKNLEDSYIGEMEILRLDTLSGGSWIVSGKFNFKSFNDDKSDSVKITDGRFDLLEGQN